MSSSVENVGVLNLSGIRVDQIGLMQIYSPSRLYSVIIPMKVQNGLCMKELFILNNATKNVKKYSLKTSETSEPEDLKVNHLYWLADFLLVAVIERDREIIQVIFTVDHVTNSVVKDRERKFAIAIDNNLFSSQAINFVCSIPVTSLLGADYLAWHGKCSVRNGYFHIFLIPKNPLANIEMKQYVTKVSTATQYAVQIFDIIEKTGYRFHDICPKFSKGSQLLCKIGVTNDSNTKQELFGVYVTYEITKLIDIYGKEDYDLLELEYIQESAMSLTFLPKPPLLSSDEFYVLENFQNSALENQCLMMKSLPEQDSMELRLINFDTMEYQSKILEKKGFNIISLHPDGIVFLWNMTAERIEYRKVIFNWKTDSLLDISRKSLMMNEKCNPLEIQGLQPILFPGSEIVLKSNTKKTAF